jgi:hypothetical protein
MVSINSLQLLENMPKIKHQKMTNKEKTANLEAKISIYKGWAFILIFSGLTLGITGLILFFPDNGVYPLIKFGEYAAGVTGTLWALAGIFFIYVAFLGQQLEINLQREDLQLTREQITLATLEAEGQKIALNAQVDLMKDQGHAMKKQANALVETQAQNTFFHLQDELRSVMARSHKGSINGNAIFIMMNNQKTNDNRPSKILETFPNVEIPAILEVTHSILILLDTSQLVNKPMYYNILNNSFSVELKEIIEFVIAEHHWERNVYEKFVKRMNNRFAQGNYS